MQCGKVFCSLVSGILGSTFNAISSGQCDKKAMTCLQGQSAWVLAPTCLAKKKKLDTRNKFMKTHASNNMHFWVDSLGVLCDFHSFKSPCLFDPKRRQKKKHEKKNTLGAHSTLVPPTFPKGPFRSKTRAQKEPIPSFGGGQRIRASQPPCNGHKHSIMRCAAHTDLVGVLPL